MILTSNLWRSTGAVDATALMLDGELVEHGPTIGMFTNPKEEPTERDVSGKVG